MSDEQNGQAQSEQPDCKSGRSHRWRLWLRVTVINMALLFASLFIAFLLGEGLFRIVAPQQLIEMRPDIWQPVDTLGWVSRPNVNTTINTGERTVRVITDHEGMRVGEDGRRDGDVRVLLLGDSFMQALQVEHEQSLAGLLEMRLPSHVNSPVTVRNAGVDGWSPPNYLARARQLLSRDEFDLMVVALYLGNDVITRRVDVRPPRQPAQRHNLRLPRRLAWGEIIDAVLYPINDIFETRSHLFIFFKRRLHSLLLGFGLTADEFPTVFLRSEATSTRWTLTADVCRDIKVAGVERGTPTLFVLIPAPSSIDPQVFEEFVVSLGMDPEAVDLDQPTQLLRSALHDLGLTVVSLLDEFRAAHTDGIQLYGSVDRHLTPVGHEKVAEILEPHIVQLLMER